MSVHVNHEWSEDGHCAVSVHQDIPAWRFSLWDVAGIALTTVGGLFGVVGQGINLLAREFNAAAEYGRNEYNAARERFEEEQARAEMAGTLEGLVFFDSPDEGDR